MNVFLCISQSLSLGAPNDQITRVQWEPKADQAGQGIYLNRIEKQAQMTCHVEKDMVVLGKSNPSLPFA